MEPLKGTTAMDTGQPMNRRTMLRLAAASSVAALLAACGGSSATEAPKPAATTASGAATTPAGSAAAATRPATTGASATTAPASTTAASGSAPAGTTAASGSAPAGTTAASGSAVAVAPSGTAAGGWPAYYPADYQTTVDGAKKEQKLLIYSIMSKENWKPVLEAFKKRYSFLDVETADLGSSEVFQRYYSEAGSNARTGDMIMTSSPDEWQAFIKKGELAPYESPEGTYVPAWSKLAPGVYSVSSDPLVFIYNKKTLAADKTPKTMAELAANIEKSADPYKGKMTTYDPEKVATGFAAFWFYIKKNGDKGWAQLETIGKQNVKLESSAGNMVNATLTGESNLGFFVSTISVLPKLPASEAVLGYRMIADGTPILVRGQGITKKAQSPNAAKLMMDFILSQDGQIAFAEGGLTAYRPDVADKAKIHLNKLAGDVGEDNLLKFFFDPDLTDKAKTDAFLARLKKTFGR